MVLLDQPKIESSRNIDLRTVVEMTATGAKPAVKGKHLYCPTEINDLKQIGILKLPLHTMAKTRSLCSLIRSRHQPLQPTVISTAFSSKPAFIERPF